MQPPPVSWPAIIKIDGDAELIYIRDRNAWEQDGEHHNFVYRDSDRLIDASGKLYFLTPGENGCVIPEPANRMVTPEEIAGLVRAHAAQVNTCCIEKIAAPSIKEMIKLVATLDK